LSYVPMRSHVILESSNSPLESRVKSALPE
jgi:hypothetical protein